MTTQDQRRLSIACLLVLLLTACVPFVPATPMPTSMPPVVELAIKVVRIHLSEATTARVWADLSVGDTARMEATFEPVMLQVSRRSDGSVYSTSYRAWAPHTVTEMQVCTALDRPCQLPQEWMPFQAEQTIEVPVEWVGAREFWLAAQFRDAQGKSIPSVKDSYTAVESVTQASYVVVGTVAEGTDVAALPQQVQTAVAATRSAFPVRGSVEIEGGGCCAGGTAGDSIQLEVAFEATSLQAEIEQMRVRTGGQCFTEEEMVQARWEPFVTKAVYPLRVAINWIGFYVTVQYRDARGHLSPAYCDDISVEGQPKPP